MIAPRVSSGSNAAPLTLVMGVQRSGTTALFGSLARDPRLTAFDEGEGPLFGARMFLRPESVSRQFLHESGPIVIKPLNETKVRDVANVLDEFAEHTPRALWIFRDAVNVFRSWIVEGWASEYGVSFFLHDWNVRNRRMLSALNVHGSRIVVVRYEDLILDERVWRDACDAVGIEGEYNFRAERQVNRRSLSQPTQAAIDCETADVSSALDAARTFRPSLWRRSTSVYGRSQERKRKERLPAAMQRNCLAVAKHAAAGSAARSPSDIDGLRLWLHGATIPVSCDGATVTHWPAHHGSDARSGPGRGGGQRAAMAAAGRAAMHFAPADAEDLDPNRLGFTCGSGSDWDFLYDGSPWTVMMVYRAIQRRSTFEASVLVQTGDPATGCEFAIAVTGTGVQLCAIATCAPERGAAFEPVVLSATMQDPAAADAWRVATWVHHPPMPDPSAPHEREPVLSSYVAQRLVNSADRNAHRAYPDRASGGPLHIGYTPSSASGPFAGDIAELVVFAAALDDPDRTGAIRHLLEKYELPS